MDRLKRIRAAFRTQVTKLISEADPALESHAEEKALKILTGRLSSLEIQLNEADAAKSKEKTKSEATPAPSDGNRSSASSKVKLPMLALQRFSGAASEWQLFWEQFRKSIHDNEVLSNAEKTALTGKAASVVAGIQVT
ncbi:hypothetical protein HPB48_020228 [Haemaphysalis longicornis]|uniref:Uncharacterized protein n=1 Tax=Haemaphysalis longicornis TaxID=44386 RepID=A0A9J6FCT9_HAELO|nr:hypothetical protein HPB48_020228 [Haemaphysalis longicornis]